MPNPPSTDGLPPWLQVVVSLAFLLISVAALRWGYRSDRTEHAPTTFAHLADMQPIRDLSTHVATLTASIERLCVREQETEHWTRNDIEEMVRLRHALEQLTRTFDRWQSH